MPYFVYLILGAIVEAAPFIARLLTGAAVALGIYELLNVTLLPKVAALFQSITQQAGSLSGLGDLAYQIYVFLGFSHLVSLILATGMVCIYLKITATSVKAFSIKA